MQTDIEQPSIHLNGNGKSEMARYNELLSGVLELSPELRAMLVQRVVASLAPPRQRNVAALMERVRTRPRSNQKTVL